ncbi:MAG: hypothetical protein EGP82_02650 [Odoribacter splanchnicus]|nr:hypothetical protein [Odoribacter splanchnicus]
MFSEKKRSVAFVLFGDMNILFGSSGRTGRCVFVIKEYSRILNNSGVFFYEFLLDKREVNK